ncbi:hypothetical protein A3G67_01320 [Candidatus Roizmanbacteria bacterium RIFCSPLOWO2_12_FULL_40_12]|uniref:GIY-YIG domain-containing protein n=1 Tax=Candidatus Roizmanbacteria bacterium RIFCSPLOWO2_01_FULL_40_42 TaxID=1802066 RepID=A0A1F7J538_9BACT|nr:MAG: hypothetical protein A2779_01795 [Candidatus Roizmanbacteria bacterium RIFCSPHIGHO2_01_FULL_40_98]OGK28544.1 MAG: hypothetical protein A3C31_01115 [Candidatus Roizmanbacteria bacterium RIFCSPHIGHO2_02_FULL_40_53]OGK30414.1 MAG: hypothetical protein A2W49_00850 [Candidatus Roizmanbacteria bacterium RIFCSPHIGHO2_12_41_18]OGK36555.1 MAG: hypothetical protein A3E69_03445 [Candidatus Roizmanbacteria bacterium RIFCSPHIGHO2_12_FULL_40_130]OGK50732.1 MAG: hypothetical protein A3B50_04505 [Candi
MYYVYIIQSYKNNHYYTGHTKNLKQRVIEHNSNNTKSLRNKGPFHLIYVEKADSLIKAIKREKQIKSYKGGKAFKKLMDK